MPDLWMDVDAALAEVPVNILPLLDNTDFKSREESVAYNAAGLELIWHFVTTAGATSATVVTPTTGGAYDWAHQDGGMYTIEIPASGGASINNDTEGFGWFTGVATGVLPWRGPTIGFRAAGLNDKLIDSAYSATRGLAGTALPDAAADAEGGLPISDAGGLDLDAQIGTDIDAILVDTGTTLQAELDGIQADTEDIQTQIGAAGAGLTAITGVKLDATQGAVTFGQVKITANVAYEGALDVVNSHTDGYGLKNFGGTYGQFNEATGEGIRVGLRNSGLTGQENFGAGTDNAGLFNFGGSGADGQRNNANSAIGLNNVGTVAGQKNVGDDANLGTGTGLWNEGTTIGEYNVSTDGIGQLNAGDAKDVEGFDPALATEAELAKIPKSDSNVSWNATALAAINAEVDTALNTAIPGSPTADSINERVATMDGRILGTVSAGTHSPQTGDAYAVVNHADYGNAKLVRSTTPANTLTVDASHQALALTNAVTNDAITAAAIANGAIDAATFAAGAIDAAAIADNAIDAGAIADGAIDNGALAADAITAAKIAADVTTELQSGLAAATAALVLATPANKLVTDASGRVSISGTKNTLDSLNDAAAAPSAGDVADAVWDETAAHHVAAGSTGKALADVLVDTAEIGVAGAGLTNINLPNQTMDITGSLSGSVGSVTGAVGSVTGAVGSVTGAVGSVTGAVGSIAAGGIAAASFAAGAIDAAAIKDGAIDAATFAAGAITAAAIATNAIDADALAADGLAEIADAVWDEALAGHAGAGTAGAALSAATAPTAADVADAVWDEALAGHADAGSTGAALSAAGAAGDPWITALPGAYADGTAGDIIGNLVTDIGALTPAVAISATTAASVSTGALAVRTHHSLSQAISSTYAGNLNAATKLWLAVKAEKDDTDAQAVIFIEATAGLTYLAGAAYTTVAHGSLTVGGVAGAWTVTVALDEVATGLLTAYADGMLWAECKALVAGATVAVWDGVCDVARGIVNATS